MCIIHNRNCTIVQRELILPDRAINDDRNCGTACKDIRMAVQGLVFICVIGRHFMEIK